MQRATVSRSQAILVAITPFIIISIIDGAFREYLRHSPAWFWTFDLFKLLLLPTVSLLWLGRNYFVLPENYGLPAGARGEPWPYYLGFIAFVTAVLWFFLDFVGRMAWIAFGQPEPDLYFKSMAPNGVLRAPAVLYFAVTAGLFEEIFFRGLPLLYLQEKYPKAVPSALYILGTSILFGAIHWENGPHEVVATFLYGILAATLYLRLRDLWPFVAAHSMIDVWAFW